MEKIIDKKAIAGVSIVEIMFSLVLVALALIAVATVFPNMNRHRKGIQEAEQAKIIAMEALEFMQNGGYTCSEIKNGSDDFYNNYADTIDMGSAKYVVSRSPSTSITCTNELNTVDVYVTWRKSGKKHTITMTGALR